MPNQVLGAWILQFNGNDQIVRLGNYCCLSIRVVSIDENKNSHRRIIMTHTQTTSSNCIALRTVNKTLLHSVEWAAAGIGLHVNAHKTEYICFNERGDISTVNGSSLKLVNKFPFLGSSVSSTETDINTRQAKAWKVNDRLSVVWKSDQTDKMKHSFFQAAVVSILLYGPYRDAN